MAKGKARKQARTDLSTNGLAGLAKRSGHRAALSRPAFLAPRRTRTAS